MIERQDAIGQVSMALLDRIEKEYPPEVAPVLRQVIILTEVEYTDEDGDRSTDFMYDYDEKRHTPRAGLMVYSAKGMGLL